MSSVMPELTLSYMTSLLSGQGSANRPKEHGERLSLEDFEFESPKTGDWRIGMRPVLTNLWVERMVHALITLSKSENGSRRLFFCTKDPESLILDHNSREDETIHDYRIDGARFLPIVCYSRQWHRVSDKPGVHGI